MMSKQPQSLLLNNSQIHHNESEQSQELNGKVLLFNKNTYLVPVRTYFILKKIKNIDISNSKITIDYTQLIWLNLKGLPNQIKSQLSGDEQIKYRLNEQAQEGFSKQNSVIREVDNILTITYRGDADLQLTGNVRYAPFITFIANMNFELSHFEMDIQDKHYIIRYNIHQNLNSKNNDGDQMMAIKVVAQLDSDFGINNSYLKVEFPMEQKKDSKKKDIDQSLKYFPTCKFMFQIYKRPLLPVITAFIPMFILAWLLLSITKAPNDLNARTANVSVVLLAYISFLTTLRQMIPPSSILTLSDFVLYSNLFATLIVLFDSYLNQFKNPKSDQYDNSWNQQTFDSFCIFMQILICLFLFFPYLIVALFILYHYLYLEQKYQNVKQTEKKQAQDSKFDKEWIIPESQQLCNPELIRVID